MQSIKRYRARDAYIPTLQQLVDFGEPVDVRGRKTVEILDFVTEIEHSEDHCILVPERRWNPWIAMSEALWILAGRNDIAALRPYNSHIGDYSDDGVTLYGAYGARIYNQIDSLIERLRRDPSDRRAVLQIWDRSPDQDKFSIGWSELGDLTTESKDPPCNNMVYFKLRDGFLHMTVINRSNDIHWGLYAVNIPTFGILQEYIAARLGVKPGKQTHLSNSLHTYTDSVPHNEITDRMLYAGSENLPHYPEHDLLFRHVSDIKSHEETAEQCSNVLDGQKPKLMSYFFDFAHDFLKAYRERDMKICNKYIGFDDWLIAGQLFADRMWSKNVSRVSS